MKNLGYFVLLACVVCSSLSCMSEAAVAAASDTAVSSSTAAVLASDQRYFSDHLKGAAPGVYENDGRIYVLVKIEDATGRKQERMLRGKALLAANASLRDWALEKTAPSRNVKVDLPENYQRGKELLLEFAERWCKGVWNVTITHREFTDKTNSNVFVLAWAMSAKDVEKAIPEAFRLPLSQSRVISGLEANVQMLLAGKQRGDFLKRALGDDFTANAIDVAALKKKASGDAERIIVSMLGSEKGCKELWTVYGRLLMARGLNKDAKNCFYVALGDNACYLPAWFAFADVCKALGEKEMAVGAGLIARGLSVSDEDKKRAEAFLD